MRSHNSTWRDRGLLPRTDVDTRQRLRRGGLFDAGVAQRGRGDCDGAGPGEAADHLAGLSVPGTGAIFKSFAIGEKIGGNHFSCLSLNQGAFMLVGFNTCLVAGAAI